MSFPTDILDVFDYDDAKHPEMSLLSMNSKATVTNIRVRGFTRKGTIELSHIPTSDRAAATQEWPLPDYPIALQVDSNGAPDTGQTFVLVKLRHSGITKYVFVAGYIDSRTPLVWPGGNIANSLEGPGNEAVETGTDPAANVEISETIPTNAFRELESMKFSLVTDANVADRTVSIGIYDATPTLLFLIPFGAVQAASLTRTYYVLQGDQDKDAAFDAGGNIRMWIPKGLLTLPQGYKWATVTTNRQATDNFGAPITKLREWLQE